MQSILKEPFPTFAFGPLTTPHFHVEVYGSMWAVLEITAYTNKPRSPLTTVISDRGAISHSPPRIS